MAPGGRAGRHPPRLVGRERGVSPRPRDHRQTWTHGSLDHPRRGDPPDAVQRRGDALHGGDRRAGLLRVHADPTARHLLGLVLRNPLFPPERMACVGGECRWRGVLSRRRSVGRTRRRHQRLFDRTRDLRCLLRPPTARAPDRADPRDPQLVHGVGYPPRLRGSGGRLRARGGVGADVGRFRGGPRSRCFSTRNTRIDSG